MHYEKSCNVKDNSNNKSEELLLLNVENRVKENF